VFFNAAPCRLANSYSPFEGSKCLHLHSETVKEESYLKDNIKLDVNRVMCAGVDRIYVVQEKFWLRAVMNAVLHIGTA
jgi:hypothetical protein